MTSKVMEKLTNGFKMDIESIASDMANMGIYKIQDIKEYGFSDEEARAIQRAIN